MAIREFKVQSTAMFVYPLPRQQCRVLLLYYCCRYIPGIPYRHIVYYRQKVVLVLAPYM